MSWTCTNCGEVLPSDVFQCRCGALNYAGTGADEPPSKRLKEESLPPMEFDPVPLALVGKKVEIQGLSKKPELNGTRALVKEFDFASSRYTAEVEGGRGVFKLKRANLREIVVGAAPSLPTQMAEFVHSIGKPMEVQGHSLRPELNGLRCVVKEFDPAAGRYTVAVDGGGTFKLNLENLRETSQAASAGPTQRKIEGTFAMGYNRMIIKTFQISSNDKGTIIGTGGKQISQIRLESGAMCSIDAEKSGGDACVMTLRGTVDQIEVAERLVNELLTLEANRPRWDKPVEKDWSKESWTNSWGIKESTQEVSEKEDKYKAKA